MQDFSVEVSAKCFGVRFSRAGTKSHYWAIFKCIFQNFALNLFKTLINLEKISENVKFSRKFPLFARTMGKKELLYMWAQLGGGSVAETQMPKNFNNFISKNSIA